MRERTQNCQAIPILVYHQIDVAPPKGAAFRSLYVASEVFARQMRLLKLLGYQGLSISALLPYLRGEKRGKVCGITFDDGYLNNLQHALPVLYAHGFSSTCYVVSQRLGQTNDWDEEVGIAPAPLMNVGHLNQWIAGGQEIGAHTRQHAHLPAMTGAESFEELATCKAELEALVHVPVQHFCYPYGEFEPSHVDMAKRAGYLTATTTARARCHAGDDFWHLPRVPVLRSTTLPVFWLKLATAYEDRRTA
jgi:peptidoglycan/xylan/chitin deacetylase (PgdA/CDA1 family)